MNHSQKICLALMLALAPATSFAYLDPGTGSLILQSLLAAIAGAALTLKFYGHRVKIFFLKLMGKAPPEETPEPPPDEPA